MLNLILALLIGAPAGGLAVSTEGVAVSEAPQAIILPHHLLVERDIDEFYKQVSEARPRPERILLISPNHFGRGRSYVQSTSTPYGNYRDVLKFDLATINELFSNRIADLEPETFFHDHGINVHYTYLLKYFPSAEIVPIVVKPEATEAVLERLVGSLSQLDSQETLVIASIDFTHNDTEEFALKNDQRIIDWLNAWSISRKDEVVTGKTKLTEITSLKPSLGSPEGIAMDSPESLYTLIRLLEEWKSPSSVNIWKRTSSAMFFPNVSPADMTSHLFVAL